MKSAIKTLLAAAITIISVSAMATSVSSYQPITIDFEGVNSFASVGEYNNGGTDAVGNSDTNYGVSFTPVPTPSTKALSVALLGPPNALVLFGETGARDVMLPTKK